MCENLSTKDRFRSNDLDTSFRSNDLDTNDVKQCFRVMIWTQKAGSETTFWIQRKKHFPEKNKKNKKNFQKKKKIFNKKCEKNFHTNFQTVSDIIKKVGY
jgi:hypothetical protein